MFKRKLTALDHINPESFNINGKYNFNCFCLMLKVKFTV